MLCQKNKKVLVIKKCFFFQAENIQRLMKRKFSKLTIALEITIRSNDPISGVSESKNELTISLLEWRTIPHYQFQLNLDLNK